MSKNKTALQVLNHQVAPEPVPVKTYKLRNTLKFFRVHISEWRKLLTDLICGKQYLTSEEEKKTCHKNSMD